jgi:hypothetical protein
MNKWIRKTMTEHYEAIWRFENVKKNWQHKIGEHEPISKIVNKYNK